MKVFKYEFKKYFLNGLLSTTNIRCNRFKQHVTRKLKFIKALTILK